MKTKNNEMEAIIKPKKAPGAKLVKRKIPKIGEKEVLVKVKATSICGTDAHIYNWDEWAQNRIRPPLIFGHELAGEVIKAGKNVSMVKEGDYVSAESHLTCGKCFYCRTGQEHVCEKTKILGVDIDGCFAEYVKIPEENLWKNDKNIPLEVASIREPLGNAIHAVFSVKVTGNKVVILGAGPIGLFSIPIAKMSGASDVIVVEVSEYRRKLAQELGADLVLNPNEKNVFQIIQKKTNSLGADIVFEMSGNEKAISQGFKILRGGGIFVAFGLPSKPVKINFSEDVIFKGIKIKGIIGRKIKNWYTMEKLLSSGKLDVKKVITHSFPLKEYKKAFSLVNSRECGKVVLFP